MTVSGAKIWLSIEEMELLVKKLPTVCRVWSRKNTIDELWVKIQQELDGIKKYNEVEN